MTLVAVSKTFEAGDIRPAIEAGQRVFGENRVQEAQGKWPALKAEARAELARIDELQRETEVRFELAAWPDYHSEEPGGAEKGRTLFPLPFDGKRLGLAGYGQERPIVPDAVSEEDLARNR